MPDDPFDFGEFRTPPGSPQAPASSTSSHDPFGSHTSGNVPPSDDPFANQSVSGSRVARNVKGSRPPLIWMWLGIAFAVVGLALAAPSLSGVTIYVAGWAIGGPIAITVLTIYARKDTAAQTSPYYNTDTWVPRVYRAAFVLCLFAVVAEALRIGHWAGYR